tara:strand:- start:627 stop:1088 length:462 start_codon:yes stop_codon:yes gene_type:complete
MDEIERAEEKLMIKDGGVYLLVVDQSSEFKNALRTAAAYASSHNAHVALLEVIEEPGFQQWGAVEAQMIQEARKKSEEHLWDAAQLLYDIGCPYPSFYIEAGNSQDALLRVLEDDHDVRALVLAASPSSNPLISYFSGKGLSNLKVPLFIIPE